MKVVYFSMTGQTRKFVQKLGMETLELNPNNPFEVMEDSYIVVTPTYDAEVTEILEDFIETSHNRQLLKGVAGGGNLNFGPLFVFTAKELAEAYRVPLLHTFEFQGMDEDVKLLKKAVDNIDKSSNEKNLFSTQ